MTPLSTRTDDERELAETDFWLTVMASAAAGRVMAGKLNRAAESDKRQQRKDLVASALKQARDVVRSLERVEIP